MPATVSQRVPSYRLHKPTGQAVVTIDGKDHYLGRHETPESRVEYHRLIGEWEANGRRRPSANEGDMTVNEVLLAYLRFAGSYYVKNGKPTTEPHAIAVSVRPLRALYGHILAKDFGPLALKTVRQELVDSGLCRNEVNKRTGRIVRAFKWAVENELLPPSVHHGLSAVAGLRRGRSGVRESKPVKPVPEAFVDAVRPHVARQIWAMVEIQRLSGMRPGEVCIMRTCDIDTTGRIWFYTPESHKTEHHGKERRISLGPQAQALLRPWLRPELTAYLFSPREAMAERKAARRLARKSPVQPSQRDRSKANPKKLPGLRYDTRSYHHAVRYGCKAAQVPTWHPNQLRHSAATRLRKEFGLDTARAVLGHSSTAVTEVYAELDREKAAEAMARIG